VHVQKIRQKQWALFCVHDDTKPFLEFYDDEDSAKAHKPNEYTCLAGCSSVSPCIMPENTSTFQYVFVVALKNLSLEFGAKDR
jgi:hypothetical protein